MLDSLYGNLLGDKVGPAAKPPAGDEKAAGPEKPIVADVDGDSPYGNLLEPIPPKESPKASDAANDMFSEPPPDQRNPAAPRARAEAPASSPAGSLPQTFSAAKLMMPPVRKKAEPVAGKRPVITPLDIQRLQEEKEALMRQRAAAAERKDPEKPAAGLGAASEEDRREATSLTTVPASSSTATASAASPQGAANSLYTSLYGSPDEEYDPAKPNDYDEFCRRRMRLKAEEDMERRRQDTLARQQAAAKPPEPREETAAEKMMKKMGWKEGQGLGKEGQGMSTPLVMKKTDRQTGVVVEGAKREAPTQQAAGQPQAKQQKPTAPTGPPTRVILLNNLVGAGEVDEDLEEETAEEAGKYGKLKRCTIKEIKGVADDQAVRIFLEYETVEDATKALVDMNGRYFGGRVVRARFFDEGRFAKGDLDKGADE